MLSTLDDIRSYKNKILAALLNSKDIVRHLTKLPDCTPQEAAGLIYTQIFPYLLPLPLIAGCHHVSCLAKEPSDYPNPAVSEPERIIGEQPIFICFEVEVTRTENLRLKEMKVSAWIYCDKDHLDTTHKTGADTLPDVLVSFVDGCLNGSVDLGLGQLKLSSASCFVPMENYYGRQLVYHVMDFM